jgi:methylase of polypeptide subunit release factors
MAPLLNDSALMAHIRNKRVLIIANLPYIPESTILPTDVIHDDPALALWG